MSSIHYRKATEQDHLSIVNYQIAMAKESEGLKLDRATVEKGVRAVFDDPAKGRYFIAEESSQTIASLLIQNEWSDWRNGTVWWIHSVYVEPAFRRRGVFGGLYRHVQQLALADDCIRGLRLYVDKSNLPAQDAYRKLGMSDEHYHLYEWMKTF
jgi:ribosomal protein S18 acetylase RimI-like enzyme